MRRKKHKRCLLERKDATALAICVRQVRGYVYTCPGKMREYKGEYGSSGISNTIAKKEKPMGEGS